MPIDKKIEDSSKLTLEFIENELAEASSNRKHPLRRFSMATQSEWGPEARTVILRFFDRKTRSLLFYTHAQSSKYSELQYNPRASCLGYHTDSLYQIRLRGVAGLHLDNELTLERWGKTALESRKNYLTKIPPGSPLDYASSGLPEHLDSAAPSKEESEQGYRNFAVIQFQVREIDWLYLGPHGHRRCLFQIDEAGKTKAQWIIP